MSKRLPPQEPSGPSAGASAPLGGRDRAADTDRLATYYRCRCIVLEAALESLQRRLQEKDAELEDVVARYERIIQDRPDCQGQVSAASRTTGE